MHFNKEIVIIIYFILGNFFSNGLYAQSDYSWWNEAHNWDGVTHWTDYIIMSPYYMGPNSLPVLVSQKGKVGDKIELKTEYIFSFSSGDKTHSLQLNLYIPVVKKLIALEFYGAPFESYSMDYKTIIERRARNLGGKGISTGDLYFSTIIQILKKEKWMELTFRMGCKTASGSNIANARFTDAPGYFTDISIGKDFDINHSSEIRFRPHGMIGFYSWQMNLPNHHQNDAIYYGAGIDSQFLNWILNLVLEGYVGYFGNELVVVGNPQNPVPFNDRPMLLKFEIGYAQRGVYFYTGYNIPLNDFIYDQFKLGLVLNF